jgi:hypothetical protein
VAEVVDPQAEKVVMGVVAESSIEAGTTFHLKQATNQDLAELRSSVSVNPSALNAD